MYKHALIVGKFAPPHRGHMYLIDAARAQADRVTLLVWSNPDFSDMSSERRANWLRQLYPTIEVRVPKEPPLNTAPDDEQRRFVKSYLAVHKLTPDVVFSSETYGPGFAAAIGCHHVMVDQERTNVTISGTAVRADVHRYSGMLDPRVYQHFVQRVVFLGAESTGKSTLTEQMAAEYQTAFVPEVGRFVWQEKKGELSPDDYVAIALGHRQLEDEAILKAHRYLFVDTNAITTMFFSYYYGREARDALKELANDCKSRYAHTFVCADDIAFEQDGWRDNAEWRKRAQGMVLYDLAIRGIGYETVAGSIEARVMCVRSILDREGR